MVLNNHCIYKKPYRQSSNSLIRIVLLDLHCGHLTFEEGGAMP